VLRVLSRAGPHTPGQPAVDQLGVDPQNLEGHEGQSPGPVVAQKLSIPLRVLRAAIDGVKKSAETTPR
jgi:hypothetical protein